ncbi:MAG: hypothetical protein DMF88_18280 [Acidobacteria bacterium]|nr:MAG: hypothetical protein DMF88_18280 [Acidobacteriota bacterium]
MRARLVKDGAEALEHGPRAGHCPRIEQRQQELGIVGLELLEILDVAYLMADDDAEIPERVEKAVDEALLRGTDAIAEEQQQIDVGVQAEMAASIAAERDDGNRPVVGARVGELLADERVDAIRVALERAAPAGAARDRRAQLFSRGMQRSLQRSAGGIRPRYRHAGNIAGLARTII